MTITLETPAEVEAMSVIIDRYLIHPHEETVAQRLAERIRDYIKEHSQG